jgi:protein involved in polysaccharide export with SLBB domain
LSEQPLTSTHNAGQPQPAQLEAIHSVVEQLEARKPEGRIVLEMDPAAAHLPGDLKLENNDTIYVPPPPTTVGVFGSVPNPSSFRFRPNMTLRDFLERAGGVQKSGDRSQIFVVRANGALLAPHRGLFGRNVLNQRALPGDLIFVPIAGARESIWAKINTLSSVLVQGAIIASSVAVVSR